mmetsp:Transcript_25381/g.55456  ORF Transcript_25381/g.55456 Transcript_25381/m.55456 type:complete len:82 (-) Transcript_25381:1399-1644(-)|eukprot:CAMPEP_0178625608 /NCGR_PEP_ID=MMETSP0698-20121128/7971_1 /TAXON_ID=265572 /ORGANISM="Extubocellulus spinifer, Strain CCMP396" /LENGTH=81 /DNA_ID=CAMNT_0020264787 /DNA_START=130 /DNA_END=375 /DNA_ORIENTATION=-
MSDEGAGEKPSVKGSWTPVILILAILIVRWLAYSKGDAAIKFRRWLGGKKVQLKKQFGYRDDEKYKMKAGGGADQRLKRQG